ncbi:MAG: sensor histidine kinase [Myxococcota bacterium]
MPTATSRQHHEALAFGFARRMAPLAIALGLAVAAGLPLVTLGLRAARLHAEARLYAEVLAQTVAAEATRNPRVWPYRLDKALPRAEARAGFHAVASIRVRGCDGALLYEEAGQSSRHTVVARHRARGLHGEVGEVEVRVGTSQAWSSAGHVALASAPMGVLLGLLLYLFPLGVVRQLGSALRQANSQIYQANQTLTERVEEATEELRELSGELLTIQDAERERIAMELHDGVGQMLSAIRFELEREGDSTEEAIDLVRRTLEELRVVIHDLRPVALEGSSLEEVLRDSAERFEVRSGVAVFFRYRPSPEASSLPGAHAVALLRIFQEALHNVAKHAQASEVGITLEHGERSIVLSVEDDGHGIEATEDSSGHGLGNMRTRASLLGGDVQIAATDDSGTIVRVELPLPSSE